MTPVAAAPDLTHATHFDMDKLMADYISYQFPSAICQKCGLNGCTCRDCPAVMQNAQSGSWGTGCLRRHVRPARVASAATTAAAASAGATSRGPSSATAAAAAAAPQHDAGLAVAAAGLPPHDDRAFPSAFHMSDFEMTPTAPESELSLLASAGGGSCYGGPIADDAMSLSDLLMQDPEEEDEGAGGGGCCGGDER